MVGGELTEEVGWRRGIMPGEEEIMRKRGGGEREREEEDEALDQHSIISDDPKGSRDGSRLSVDLCY